MDLEICTVCILLHIQQQSINCSYNRNKFVSFCFLKIVALEECPVSSTLVPLKSLIQGSACQVLKKTDLAVKVRKSALKKMNTRLSMTPRSKCVRFSQSRSLLVVISRSRSSHARSSLISVLSELDLWASLKIVAQTLGYPGFEE